MEEIRVYKLNDLFDFGEFEGKSVESVARENPDYFISTLAGDNGFVISKEDLKCLQQKYARLEMYWYSQGKFDKKIETIDHKEFRAIFNENMSQWSSLKESSRSKLQRERYPSDLELYVRLDYNKDSHVTQDKHTWKFVRFGVDQNASPMIEVYCYSVMALRKFYVTTVKVKDKPIHYFKFSLNMNDFDFGYLARTLEEMRMVIR